MSSPSSSDPNSPAAVRRSNSYRAALCKSGVPLQYIEQLDSMLTEQDQQSPSPPQSQSPSQSQTPSEPHSDKPKQSKLRGRKKRFLKNRRQTSEEQASALVDSDSEPEQNVKPTSKRIFAKNRQNKVENISSEQRPILEQPSKNIRAPGSMSTHPQSPKEPRIQERILLTESEHQMSITVRRGFKHAFCKYLCCGYCCGTVH